jgi:putative endopeptidase
LDALFKSNAALWLNVAVRARSEYLLQVDTHNAANARVNRTMQNFEEFYNTYGIKEGDGMYLPPERRVKIW